MDIISYGTMGNQMDSYDNPAISWALNLPIPDVFRPLNFYSSITMVGLKLISLEPMSSFLDTSLSSNMQLLKNISFQLQQVTAGLV